MCNFQERNWAFSAPSEAWLLREAGHEGHPHRSAYDLHPPPHVHRDVYEEVTREGLPGVLGLLHTRPTPVARYGTSPVS